MNPDQLRAWRRRIFAVSWLTYAGFYLGRVNLAVALPALQAQFGWSKVAVGLLGSALYWAYAGGQLINGHLGDRLSARKLVAIGLVASAILNLTLGSLSTLGLMIVVCALNGWAQSTGWGPIMSTLARWFTPQQRGRLTAFFSPCYVAGHALSWALAGLVTASWGWRNAFFVPGLLLLGVAAFWYLLARDSPRQAMPGAKALPDAHALSAAHTGPEHRSRSDRPGLWASLRGIVQHPRLRWALITCALSGMIKEGLSLWAPTYLVQEQGFALASAALSGALIPVAGAIGAVTSGWLVHRFSPERESPVVAGLAVALGLASLALYWVGPSGQPWLALMLLAAMGWGSHGINALLLMSVPLSLGAKGNVSSTAGTLDFVSYAGGGLSGVLVGTMQDLWGWRAVYVFWALLAASVVLLGLRQIVTSRRAAMARTA